MATEKARYGMDPPFVDPRSIFVVPSIGGRFVECLVGVGVQAARVGLCFVLGTSSMN